jgi:pimeloyl-ACP methyl ester carboxylesterase
MQHKKAIFYTSGFNSTYKSYIAAVLSVVFEEFDTYYYVLSDRYDIDFEYLKQQINSSEYQEIHLIGHSTGGFLSLSMYRIFGDKLKTVHCINPALTLSKTLKRAEVERPEVAEKARLYVSENVNAAEILNETYFINRVFPIHFYVGSSDEVIDIPYLDRLSIDKTYFDFGHRFDETQFTTICGIIKKRIEMV